MIPNPLAYYRSDEYAVMLAQLPEHLRPYVDKSRPYLVTMDDLDGHLSSGGELGIALRNGRSIGLWRPGSLAVAGPMDASALALTI